MESLQFETLTKCINKLIRLQYFRNGMILYSIFAKTPHFL